MPKQPSTPTRCQRRWFLNAGADDTAVIFSLRRDQAYGRELIAKSFSSQPLTVTHLTERPNTLRLFRSEFVYEYAFWFRDAPHRRWICLLRCAKTCLAYVFRVRFCVRNRVTHPSGPNAAVKIMASYIPPYRGTRRQRRRVEYHRRPLETF